MMSGNGLTMLVFQVQVLGFLTVLGHSRFFWSWPQTAGCLPNHVGRLEPGCCQEPSSNKTKCSRSSVWWSDGVEGGPMESKRHQRQLAAVVPQTWPQIVQGGEMLGELKKQAQTSANVSDLWRLLQPCVHTSTSSVQVKLVMAL